MIIYLTINQQFTCHHLIHNLYAILMHNSWLDVLSETEGPKIDLSFHLFVSHAPTSYFLITEWMKMDILIEYKRKLYCCYCSLFLPHDFGIWVTFYFIELFCFSLSFFSLLFNSSMSFWSNLLIFLFLTTFFHFFKLSHFSFLLSSRSTWCQINNEDDWLYV